MSKLTDIQAILYAKEVILKNFNNDKVSKSGASLEWVRWVPRHQQKFGKEVQGTRPD